MLAGTVWPLQPFIVRNFAQAAHADRPGHAHRRGSGRTTQAIDPPGCLAFRSWKNRCFIEPVNPSRFQC